MGVEEEEGVGSLMVYPENTLAVFLMLRFALS